jgi:hypothetical protein
MRIGVIRSVTQRVNLCGHCNAAVRVSKGSQVRNRFSAADRVAGAIIALLIIVGVAACVATRPTSDVTSASSATPTSTAAPTHTAAAARTGAPPPTARAAVPAPTYETTPAAKPNAPPKAAPALPSTVQAAAPAPPSKQQPPTAAPPPPPKASCYPLSDENTCYEPGEYCRDSDHGKSGVAGDGKAIICEDDDGWRWAPA